MLPAREKPSACCRPGFSQDQAREGITPTALQLRHFSRALHGAHPERESERSGKRDVGRDAASLSGRPRVIADGKALCRPEALLFLSFFPNAQRFSPGRFSTEFRWAIAGSSVLFYLTSLRSFHCCAPIMPAHGSYSRFKPKKDAKFALSRAYRLRGAHYCARLENLLHFFDHAFLAFFPFLTAPRCAGKVEAAVWAFFILCCCC